MGQAGARTLNILVVERGAGISSVLRSMPLDWGNREIAETADPAAAVDLLDEFSADIIVCDCDPRGMPGLEMAARLRDGKKNMSAPHTHPPLLLVAAEVDRNFALAARDAGVQGLLVKPLSISLLRQRIDEALSRAAIRAANPAAGPSQDSDSSQEAPSQS